MSDYGLKLYSQYDYDDDLVYSEARINVPHMDSSFLLEPKSHSTPQICFTAQGVDDKKATENLINKLEANAKTLQAIADSLKK